MARRSQFTVDASEVQGNAGAEVTFKPLTIGEMREYRTTDVTDGDVLASHVLDWAGFEDDHGHALPSPKDEPGIVDALYLHEQSALVRLLFQGPLGERAKN